MTYLPRSDRSELPTAVWVCEHPYRTLRLDGPSRDCGDCPVWLERQRAQLETEAARARDEISQLEEWIR